MIIFFRSISADTQQHEIAHFLEPVLQGKLFQKDGYIEHIKIMISKQPQKQKPDYHCLVSINPDAAAKRVIIKLNRKVFKGRHIVIREYKHRLWQNDPRVNMHEWNEELSNKRKGERRQAKLIDSSSVPASFDWSDKFHADI
jgi:RNA recognition motif-containing protein